MYPGSKNSFMHKAENGDFSGSTGSDVDPEKSTERDSCVSGPVVFL
jgi:hypothetical protein